MVGLMDKENLTDRELLLFNQEVNDRSKNTIVAYLLWWFTGFMGGHRYYMGKTGSAIAMTLIFWLLVWLFGLGAIITGIWALVDVFFIHSWLKEDKDKVETEVYNEIVRNRKNQTIMKETMPREAAQAEAKTESQANEQTTEE
jgi:TM2 domain-containing membrane protein YozV